MDAARAIRAAWLGARLRRAKGLVVRGDGLQVPLLQAEDTEEWTDLLLGIPPWYLSIDWHEHAPWLAVSLHTVLLHGGAHLLRGKTNPTLNPVRHPGRLERAVLAWERGDSGKVREIVEGARRTHHFFDAALMAATCLGDQGLAAECLEKTLLFERSNPRIQIDCAIALARLLEAQPRARKILSGLSLEASWPMSHLPTLAWVWKEVLCEPDRARLCVARSRQQTQGLLDWGRLAEYALLVEGDTAEAERRFEEARGRARDWLEWESVARDAVSLFDRSSVARESLEKAELAADSTHAWIGIAEAWVELFGDVERTRVGLERALDKIDSFSYCDVASAQFHLLADEAGANETRQRFGTEARPFFGFRHTAEARLRMFADTVLARQELEKRRLAGPFEVYDACQAAEAFAELFIDSDKAVEVLKQVAGSANSTRDWTRIAGGWIDAAGEEPAAREALRRGESLCEDTSDWCRVAEAHRNLFADNDTFEQLFRRTVDRAASTCDWIAIANTYRTTLLEAEKSSCAVEKATSLAAGTSPHYSRTRRGALVNSAPAALGCRSSLAAGRPSRDTVCRAMGGAVPRSPPRRAGGAARRADHS